MKIKKKVYLAHQISTTGEFENSKRVANLIRELGYEVYAAAENDSINDKANNPSPSDIYVADVDNILNCDVFVVDIPTFGGQGTLLEIGIVSGLNEGAENKDKIIPIIGYTSNARAIQPQFSDGIASAGMNHMVKGAVDKWGIFTGRESNMLQHLSKIKRKRTTTKIK